MKFLVFVQMFMLAAASQTLKFSSIATVSLTLVSLHKPVDCFFSMFRRRKAPPVIKEVEEPEPQSFFQRPQQGQGGFFNQFGGGGNPFGGGGGNMFFPGGFNTPSFGMLGQNRFPPQMKPPQPMIPQGHRPQVPSQSGFPPQPPRQQQFPPQFPPQQFPPQQLPPQQFQSQQFPSESEMEDEDFNDSGSDEVPGMNHEEAESFFTLLSETDESKCISRMVCEMGSNPENGGEFGQTIADIIGSLKDFPEGSKVSEYNEILSFGTAEGLSACLSKFSTCDEESYQLVKKAQMDDEGQNE